MSLPGMQGQHDTAAADAAVPAEQRKERGNEEEET